MGSKQSGNQTVQQKADPWIQAQPYLTGGRVNSTPSVATYNMGNPNIMVNNPRAGIPRGGQVNQNSQSTSGGHRVIGLLPEAEKLYQRSTNHPFSRDELSAMEAMRGRMGRDYGLVNTGLDTLQRTARGDFLGQQNFMDAYGEGILNDVNSQFAKAGRTGSGYAAEAAAKGLAQGAAPLYAQERQLQQQAALAAPQYQAGQYGLLDSDIEALMQSGFMQHNRPYENLQNYANVVLPSAGQGSTSSSSQPMYRNPLAGGLGAGLAGASLFGAGGPLAGAMGITGPMGFGIGAGLGLLGL